MDANQHPYTVGFGMNGECSHPLIGGQMEVTHGITTMYPFFIARDMVITDMGVSMIAIEEVDLASASANVFMQLLYKIDTEYFIAIPETKVILAPAMSGIVPRGQLFESIVNNLNVPVAAGSRLMLIVHKDVMQQDVTKSIAVLMSGSINLRVS